jgi:hypothetical protein
VADRFEGRIAAIAGRQHRNISREQLLDLGVGAGAITHRLKTGRFHREHAGVYAIGTPARTPLERSAAAILVCGPGSALSHMAALALWGFSKRWPAVLEVSTPNDRRPSGLTVHRSVTLGPREIRTHLGIRTTSPARTILDCARALSERGRLTRTVNDALHTPYVTRNQLAEICARHPTHTGAKLLLPFYDASDGPSRSGWEDTLKAWCTDHGLPEPLTNHKLGRYEVDGYFPGERLVIELDSVEFHSSREAILTDRERDAYYLDSGVESVRITYDRYQGGAASEAGRLGRILARRRQMLAAVRRERRAGR